MRALLLWIPAFAGMTMGGCANRIEVADSQLQSPTIVSLNPCTDAILAEVAAPDQLLAISHYSHNPASSSMDIQVAQRYRATGGTVEEILALQPNIVVAGSFLAPATRAALDDLGIRVETFGIAATVEDSHQQIRDLAGLAGQSGQGETLVADIDASLAELQYEGADMLSAVLWQPAGIVPGETALVSQLMQRGGFTNHSAAIGMGQADYLSLEQMLASPPQVLLLAGQERSQQHPVLGQIDTFKARFDTSLLYCGGPTIIRAAQRLAEVRSQASERAQ